MSLDDIKNLGNKKKWENMVFEKYHKKYGSDGISLKAHPYASYDKLEDRYTYSMSLNMEESILGPEMTSLRSRVSHLFKYIPEKPSL